MIERSARTHSSIRRTVARWLVAASIMAPIALGFAPAAGGSVTVRWDPALPPRPDRPPVAATDGQDVSVSGPTPAIEDEPSIAVDPLDPTHMIVAAQRLTGPCAYYESSDGGASWSHPWYAPLTKNAVVCYDVSVRASPDGRFFYISYLSIKGYAFISDVAVLRVSTDFTTVQGPFIAMHHRLGGVIDKDWLDVHEVDPSQANEVYVTATYFHEGVGCSILFTRSVDYGHTWAAPKPLAKYPGCAFSEVAGLGVRPLGGFGPTVLVCWYGAGDDGWGPAHGGGGMFDFMCRTSLDDGATFGPLVYAVKGERYELPYYSCPNAHYQRIWSAMLQSMAIGPDGSAHVTYARDPTENNRGGECADVRYTRSAGVPYDTWTAPVTIAGGAGAQSFSAVTATRDPQGRCRVDVAYMDSRNSPPGSPNHDYDIYRIASTDCGLTWGAPERVSDASSLADKDFVGDYIDMTVGGDRVHVVWTDRRLVRHVSDSGSDVYTDEWAMTP